MSARAMMARFWSDDFWLPPNVTWSTFEAHTADKVVKGSGNEVRFAQFDELLTPILAAAVVIVVKAVAQHSSDGWGPPWA